MTHGVLRNFKIIRLEKSPPFLNFFSSSDVRFFISIDNFDEETTLEIFPENTLKSVLSSTDFIILQGLPVIQIYTKKHAESSFKSIGQNQFRVRK